MRKIILALLIIIACAFQTKAQDVLASISVTPTSAEGTDRSVYDAMQKALSDMTNGRSWTPYQLKPDERFKIRISISISSRISDTEFKGSFNIAMGRPVFNTNYDTPIFNYVENEVHFFFNPYEPMEYIENVYTNNLVSVVGYYIYYGLGLQFDTFQPSAGQEFFDKAKNIVQSAQSSGEKGWTSADNERSRYWLVENIMNPAYRGLRSFLYQYHRQGLDIMADNQENGRTYILRSIEELKKAYDERPGLYLTQMMIDTKRDEIINIFKAATDSEKNKVVDLMKRMDASNSSKYEAIKTATSGTTNQQGINNPGSGFPDTGIPGGSRTTPGTTSGQPGSGTRY